MKALLVLFALSVAVSARPEPGFAYSVVDPGQGFDAAPTNVYSTAKYAAGNPYLYQMYGLNVPLVYNPVVYQVPACRNNVGQAVPCAGVDTVVPIVPVEQRQVQVVAPQEPVAPAAPVASEQSGVISVKKREADPLYYYNGINPVYTHAPQPVVYTQSTPVIYSQPTPVVYTQPAPVTYTQTAPVTYTQTAPVTYTQTAPVVYTAPAPVVYAQPAPVGCRNGDGQLVACVGEPEVKSEPVPEEKAAAAVEIPEQTALEAAAAAAKIFAVKKREAEADPTYYYSTVVPSQVYNPFVYANVPVVYQAGGCRNDMGYLVPCAYGNNIVTPFALPAAPVVPQAVVPAAVEEKAEEAPAEAVAAEGVISVKKREAEAKAFPDPLYYGDTYGFPGYTYRAYNNIATVAVPTRYTVSDPIVKTVGQPVFTTTYDAPLTTITKTIYSTPVVSTSYVAPIAATRFVAPAPVAAAPVPVAGCRNEQGSVVPCA